MRNPVKAIVILGAIVTLSACEQYNGPTRPGDLVPTGTFVENVLEEHGVIRRSNTSAIPGTTTQTVPGSSTTEVPTS